MSSPPPLTQIAAAIQMSTKRKVIAKDYSDFETDKVVKNPPTARQAALEKQKKQKLKESADSDESESESESESDTEPPPKNPPAGVFLSFGQRTEVHWGPHSSTSGQNADEWLYKNPHKAADRQQNSAKASRWEYKCARKDCGFHPKKSEMDSTDVGAHITVDHVPPFSKRLENQEFTRDVCDGKWVWRGVVKSLAQESYNDPDTLQYMCSSHNSSKGGVKEYERTAPEFVGSHDDYCAAGAHTDTRIIS